MCPIQYYTLMRQSKDPRLIRYQMVQFALKNGVKPAAREFNSTPKTVRKWLSRWQPGSLRGLEEKSRAPKNPFKRITPGQQRKVIKLKEDLPSWGAARIKRYFNLTLSVKAIRRIWKQEGLLRRKRRKHKTKNDLREVKARWRLFEQLDIDTKDLIDIPELWPQIKTLRLPKVQYTAREVVSGMMFLGFAQERSLTHATIFAQLLLHHLQSCGVNLQGCRWQTDNGTEFIGSWQAKEESAFTKTVHSVEGLTHHLIPPGAHTYQADVETAHGLIEDEFYEVERFTSLQNFFTKIRDYNLWFNIARTNSYKKNQTPWQIVHQRDPTIKPEIVTLKPVDLDQLFKEKSKRGFIDFDTQRGYHVMPHP
jgi:transposase